MGSAGVTGGWFWDGTDDIDIDTGVRGARYSYYLGVLFF